jgi:hypothetical protein
MGSRPSPEGKFGHGFQIVKGKDLMYQLPDESPLGPEN